MADNRNEITGGRFHGPIVQAAHIDQVVFETGTAATRSEIEHDRLRVLEGEGWVRTLRRLYPQYPLVDLFGFPVAACTFPADPEEWHDVEAPLGDLLTQSLPMSGEWSSDFFPDAYAAFQQHLATAQAKRKWNGPTFALDHIRRVNGKVRLDCRPGRYFQSLATSEACDMELMTALADDPDQPVDLSALPVRRWAHERAAEQDPVLDGTGRSAAVSVATVILAARADGGYGVLLTPRSGEVATHRLFNHVAPSGIFAPLDLDMTPLQDEFSVRRNLLREYLEELYSIEEYEIGSKPIHSIETEPEVMRLRALIDSGSANLYYTGVSVNLLTLRPEICTLLLVRDPAWLREEPLAAERSGRPWKMAWEWLAREDEHHLPADRRHHQFLPLDRDLRPEWAGTNTLTPTALIPNAAAAIDLALPIALRAAT